MTYVVTRYLFRPLSGPVARVLARTPITPLQVTAVSALLVAVSAALFATGSYLAGAIVLFVAEVTDCVDGDLARLTARSSNLGAFVDSVLDRWAEALLFVAIASSSSETLWAPALFALIGSFLTSYTRARAQGLGTDCPEGIGGRDTRILLLVIGGLAGQLAFALVAIGVVATITAIQRFVIAVGALRRRETPAPVARSTSPVD